MWTKLKAIWAKLPNQAQAAITTCAATFITTTAHAISEGGCVSAACLKHYAWTAILTASTTLYAFYMKPSNGATQLAQQGQAGKTGAPKA